MPEVRPVEAIEDALFEGSCTEFLTKPEGHGKDDLTLSLLAGGGT
jgi:hypothetical protein